jgi:hypothetical protein
MKKSILLFQAKKCLPTRLQDLIQEEEWRKAATLLRAKYEFSGYGDPLVKARFLVQLAVCELHLNNPIEAEQLLDQVIKTHALNLDIHLLKGIHYVKVIVTFSVAIEAQTTKKMDAVNKDLNRLFTSFLDDPRIHVTKAAFLAKTGQLDRAAAIYNAALNRNPDLIPWPFNPVCTLLCFINLVKAFLCY